MERKKTWIRIQNSEILFVGFGLKLCETLMEICGIFNSHSRLFSTAKTFSFSISTFLAQKKNLQVNEQNPNFRIWLFMNIFLHDVVATAVVSAPPSRRFVVYRISYLQFVDALLLCFRRFHLQERMSKATPARAHRSRGTIIKKKWK